MNEYRSDGARVACCGLYCGACRAQVRGKCGGCRSHGEGHWCRILACCREHGYRSCAECTEVGDLHDCRIFNNLMSRVFALVFRSDRFACIEAIREAGYDAFAERMAREGRPSLRRGTS